MLEPYSTKLVRIAPKNLAEMPEEVRSAILQTADRYHLKSFDFRPCPEGYSFMPWENETYQVMYGQKPQLSFASPSAESIDAKGMHPSFGVTFTPPVGTWVVMTYYAGRFGRKMVVYNIQPSALAPSTKSA